jgi:hypothetical protein
MKGTGMTTGMMTGMTKAITTGREWFTGGLA